MPTPPYSADRAEHRTLLALASEAAGIDFAAYRVATMAQRILHRMQTSGTPDLASYLALVQRSPAELGRLVDALLIKTTSMFRDAGTFSLLRETVLPALCARRADEGATSLSAWSVGCSTGEEAYSLAMCLLEVSERISPAMSVVVLATDADPRAIEQASHGRLSKEQAASVPEALAARWLVEGASGYQVADRLRSALVFDRHNALDPLQRMPRRSVLASFDVVSCRNVLIYLDAAAQTELAQRLVAACEPGSILVLGTSESLPGTVAGQCCPASPAASVFVRR